MKRKVIIGLCVFAAFILLLPHPMDCDDGGSVCYEAPLYSVTGTFAASERKRT